MNAFPSVIIKWIFAVLQWLNAPYGSLCFVRATYHQVYIYIKHAGMAQFSCFVRTGVLRGCPFAALFFVIASEPFFVTFETTVKDADLGIVRACADDIAITAQDISTCVILKKIYIAEQVAGLKFNVTKCF